MYARTLDTIIPLSSPRTEIYGRSLHTRPGTLLGFLGRRGQIASCRPGLRDRLLGLAAGMCDGLLSFLSDLRDRLLGLPACLCNGLLGLPSDLCRTRACRAHHQVAGELLRKAGLACATWATPDLSMPMGKLNTILHLACISRPPLFSWSGVRA